MTATATAAKPGALIVKRDRHYRECPECKGLCGFDWNRSNDPRRWEWSECRECAGTGSVTEWKDPMLNLAGMRQYGVQGRPYGAAHMQIRRDLLTRALRPTLAALVQAERRIAA